MPSRRPPLPPKRMQHDRLRELDALSRQRALNEAESRELERLLFADYARRLRCEQPVPRGIA